MQCADHRVIDVVNAPTRRPSRARRHIEDPVSVHDLHATLMHLFGFDHTRLTYRSQGRDFRLTDVEGEVVKKLLA
jgi:hypothetical protein